MYAAVPIDGGSNPGGLDTAVAAAMARWKQTLRSGFGRGRQALRQRARHLGRHPHLNDRTHWPVPVVEEMEADFYALVHQPGRRQFRRSQVMRRSPSEFGDHGGLSGFGHHVNYASRNDEAAKGRAASPFASLFTSRDDTSTETDR